MGFTRKRIGRNGTVRFQALYDDVKGVRQSAGTYATEKEANKAWQRAEAKLAEGRLGDPRRGRQTFKTYVEEKWLPNHSMEPSTRESYTRHINLHLMSEFGPMKMRDILPEYVREWVVKMQRKGASPRTIQYCKASILNATFTTAFDDQVIFLHPSKGVKTPTVPRKPRKIITAEQFDRLYRALPTADAQLLIEMSIESGLRWGELTELRVKDIDLDTRILTVSRTVMELSRDYHPTGGRFLVKEYPKDKEYRRLKLSTQITEKLRTHVEAERLADGDLLFVYRNDDGPKSRPRQPVDPDELGLTEPNEAGRRYKHGTMTAYNLAKCRCGHCKNSYAVYRAKRRADGRDNPRPPRLRDTDGHIPRDWFRRQIWDPARTVADLGFKPRVHDLRHAHASWLLAGGADLQVVKERLGHSTIATTEKYLHTLPDADETALKALSKIRRG
ncbi:site-specific integrase [Actinomadura craniellae]|uniref:Site-specific integrase n=1 Tax=Actinomadura craniellae TaxID=2231787 RepID=A0A365GV55_9ACTN|nr:site-specific integrase [Actinomadura craniellae]RAY10674.1 site-specific integrase [Actinomadura craniellae]